MLLSNLLREEESSMVHSYFYYPKQGGSQFIIERLASGVTLVCDSPIKKIELNNNFWVLNDTEKFDRVVFTGDVRNLKNAILTNDVELKKKLEDITLLKSNGTSNALCETEDTDLSWLYLPDKNDMKLLMEPETPYEKLSSKK